MTLQMTARLFGSVAASADGAAVAAAPDIQAAMEWLQGTASGQCDLLYSKAHSIAASGNTTIDLSGTLAGVFGANVVFARVYGIIVKAAAANVNDVLVGGNGSNPFVGFWADATDITRVAPGGIFMNARPLVGWTVTGGSNDILKFANSSSGSAVDFTVGIVGASA